MEGTRQAHTVVKARVLIRSDVMVIVTDTVAVAVAVHTHQGGKNLNTSTYQAIARAFNIVFHSSVHAVATSLQALMYHCNKQQS